MIKPTLRIRIYISMLALIIVSLLVIGWVTIVFFDAQNEQYHADRLARKEKTVLISLQYFFKDTEGGETLNAISREFEEEVTKLADINNVDINIYSMDGNILMSSKYDYANPDFYKQTVSAEILSKLMKKPHRYVESISENEVSTFSLLYGKNQEPIAVVNLPYNTDQSPKASGVKPFLTKLIEIYLFLLIGASLLAFFLSNYITKGIRTISDKLKEVKINKKNEPLQWSSNDELKELVTQYNLMIDKLEESAIDLAKSERESAWREMAKQVAHEIKNPLTPIKLSVQHLERSLKPDDEDFEERLSKFSAKIVAQIDALTHIANEFSNFAKMPKAEMSKMNILVILEQLKSLFDKHDHLELELSVEPSITGEMIGDQEQLTRVFNNLIKNAIQAIPDEKLGMIKISIYENADKYTITVSDNGEGIPEEIQGKIFTPNFTTKNSGSGLGLAMVKQIVNQHNGDIDFTTQLNVGTEFTVTLPKHYEVK